MTGSSSPRRRPTEIAARALAAEDGDVAAFVERHGRAALVTAADYAIAYADGTVTHRIVAGEMGWSPLEAAIILEALREIVEEPR